MRKAKPSLKGTEYQTYLWEKVPRQLISDAMAKAKALEPPMPLKWVLLTLLREWTYAEVALESPAVSTTTPEPTPEPPPAPRQTRKRPRPILALVPPLETPPASPEEPPELF